jgi:hypothetical protein
VKYRLPIKVVIVKNNSLGMIKWAHYRVSVDAGERRLLPAVREAAPGTTIVADGFSCREQIQQLTGRRAYHLAELLARGLTGNEPSRAPGERP